MVQIGNLYPLNIKRVSLQLAMCSQNAAFMSNQPISINTVRVFVFEHIYSLFLTEKKNKKHKLNKND